MKTRYIYLIVSQAWLIASYFLDGSDRLGCIVIGALWFLGCLLDMHIEMNRLEGKN